MKKIKRWLTEIFNPDDLNNLDTDLIRSAFNDSSVRNIWLTDCFDEIKRIHLEVDRRLLAGSIALELTDLCARRKAYQDILEAVLSARRQVVTQGAPHNPPFGGINLDRVTR